MGKADSKKRTATDGLRLREAAQRKRLAAKFLAEIGDATGAGFERREADDMARNADEMLVLPSKPNIGTGGELFLSPEDSGNMPGLAATVEDPDWVTAEASRDRLELAADAQCLAMAADAAETIRAENSLEKMLAHEMAAAHASAMRLMARAEHELWTANLQAGRVRHDSHLSATRLMNTAARLMGSFQDGMATLEKMQRGGKQVVVVQHVEVSGGQAVVTGAVNTGGNTGRGDAEK